MKSDGVTMETTEPIEAAAVAEPPSSQENIREQTPSQPEDANDPTPRKAPKANSIKSAAADPKVKPKAVASKTQPAGKAAGVSVPNPRPGPASHRTGSDLKSSNNVSAAAVKKTATKSSTGGAVPKRPAGTAAVSSTAKVQTRVPDKKPVGPARTTSAPASTVTNCTKPSSVTSAAKKKPGTESTGRLKTAVGTSRPAASTAPKPNPSTTTKPAAAASKTSRPAAGPSTSRPTSTTSRPTTATAKPPSAAAKPVTTRVTAAPPAGRTTATQPPKTAAAAKKAPDGIRASPAAVAKKPATPKAATRKPEPPKLTAPVKTNSVPKWSTAAKAADPKGSQPKPHQPAKPAPIKKPVASIPASKPSKSTQSQAKPGAKPTQAVSPFSVTKKAGVSKSTRPSAEERDAAGAAVADGEIEHASSAPPASSSDASAPEVPAPVLVQDITLEAVPQDTAQSLAAVSCRPQSPIGTASPQAPPPQEQLESRASLPTTQEQTAGAPEPSLPPVAFPPDLSEEEVYLLTDHTPSTSKVPPAATNEVPQIVSTNLNEEDDEEEREGSQLVSVSEMSGTTQPTEESRPGSGGPVGGSAWRAGAALLSELDSEEVSGSQQGASELSAPGVLEGTESMDDLGDGSLKGAIDMEGASAGSPDFEKVPDIPVNDFDEDEDEDDDDDRVCDMDVGSERADDPQRLRHDNDVDDDEDEDVEMASEGVTESGLESYGNPDDDDFVEDERLDNLNRVAQPPPPPPLLPSAPAAQWDQPNPFPDAWVEPLQPQQVLEPVSQPVQVEGAAAASPLKDPWQADSETPTQTQAWLELGSGLLGSENKDSSDGDEPLNLQESGLVPVQTLAPAPLSAPGMSLSSTLSSETSTPEELGDCCQDTKFQPQAVAPPSQPDLDYQEPVFLPMRGNVKGEQVMEAENQPADEVLGCPANASTSNPSSPSSATEDDASDTEGEAQLDDSLESPLVGHLTFDCQPAAQRCLSVVEEGEEADARELECGAVEDTTPPSATSLASYGFDTMTTASNSNAQSTGESCLKSPGIFSPEELSEETKELCLIPQPQVQPRLAEEQYVDFGKAVEPSAEHVGEDVPGTEEASDSPSTVRAFQQPEETPDDAQQPYYSAICEKTGNSFAGFSALPHPHRRDQAAHPRAYCDIIKPHGAAATPPRLTCADLPPRNLAQQALSPQLRRLEQHQRQLQELQQRREQQSRPLEEAEQERKRREEEEQRKKKEEAEEEIKRNKEEELLQRKAKEQAEAIKEEEEKLKKEEEREKRKDLQLQLQQQQEELMKWQPELQQSKGQTVLLSPSAGLSTIYEALENTDEEEVADEEEGIQELKPTKVKEPRQETSNETIGCCEKTPSDEDKHPDSSPSTEAPPPVPDAPLIHSDHSSPVSPAPSPPLDLDWGKKVDIVQQLINQTLMLNRDGCSSLLLLPGGAGGTLSPLESSLWPSLLPPLTPPSATVTSVSSFSPEATGSSPQGEWTVVELETHH